jgi:two-component sensor histidine kinase
MKHAFICREDGLIRVSILLQDKHATLIVHDNGVDIPETISPDHD